MTIPRYHTYDVLGCVPGYQGLLATIVAKQQQAKLVRRWGCDDARHEVISYRSSPFMGLSLFLEFFGRAWIVKALDKRKVCRRE